MDAKHSEQTIRILGLSKEPNFKELQSKELTFFEKNQVVLS